MDLLCRVVEVSRSGYYDWLSRPASKRAEANNMLDEKIKAIYMKNKQRYGSPRITRVLKAESIPCSHTRVERRMKHLGIRAIATRQFKVTTDSTHRHPVFKHINGA